MRDQARTTGLTAGLKINDVLLFWLGPEGLPVLSRREDRLRVSAGANVAQLELQIWDFAAGNRPTHDKYHETG
jgi:hypothetical protein